MPLPAKRHPSQWALHQMLVYDPEKGTFFSKRLGRLIGSHDSYGYGRLCLQFNTQFLAHRIAWIMVHGAIPDGMSIDHINGDRGDNRIANLRLCSHTENTRHRRANEGKILPKGVVEQRGRYRASIRVARKLFHLGYFDTPGDAQYAYAMAARSKFGRFARL